jgi:ERCC4-type nuclease
VVTPSLRHWFFVDGMTITVDVRERRSEVPAGLAALGVRISFVTLAVGDYAVGDRVIERKTVADLHRSLVGERLWSQVGALRRDPRRAYLLVEGADLDAGHVPGRAIRGALLKVLDNGIRLLRTGSPGDTALWLYVLARQELHRTSHTPSIGQRPIVASPVGLLSAIPGIGIDQAMALVAEFGSIAAIATASESDLQSIPGIGFKRAQSLIQALTKTTP